MLHAFLPDLRIDEITTPAHINPFFYWRAQRTVWRTGVEAAPNCSRDMASAIMPAGVPPPVFV
jgi:hypothetical protein